MDFTIGIFIPFNSSELMTTPRSESTGRNCDDGGRRHLEILTFGTALNIPNGTTDKEMSKFPI
jgi:hypothetical protein